MTMKEIKKQWLEDNKEWLSQYGDDRPMVNEAYFAYIDSLCKDGIISERQYNRASGIYYFDYQKNKWLTCR